MIKKPIEEAGIITLTDESVDAVIKLSAKPFGSSHVNQMLSALAAQGLVFKNRHGKYSFAVPLLAGYIKRLHLVEAD